MLQDVGLLPEHDVSSGVLDPTSSFVLVTPTEFYIWFGKRSGLNQRKLTQAKAVDECGWEVPKWVTLQIVDQDKEPYLFQEKFPSWEYQMDLTNSTPKTARRKVTDAQISKMLDFDPDLVPIIDDVYGSVEVWIASDFAKVSHVI